MLKSALQRFTREVLFHTPLRRYLFPRYAYNFTPPQLCFLCQCAEDTRNVAGAMLEIGCAAGLTTIFLNKYMDHQGIKKEYFTVDTFSGFTSEDIEFEVANRGKKHRIYHQYQVNSKRWFDGTMERNGISRVRSVQDDVNNCDLSMFGPLAFVLLDVDLYRPMKKCLPELYDLISPGGIIVVDDCDPLDVRWDGSDQAYKEFMSEINQPAKVVHGKLGIIKKAG